MNHPTLILDDGHFGKPSPHDRDRGAVSGDRIEHTEVVAYSRLAAGLHVSRGGSVIRPQLPATYSTRQREANAIAALRPSVPHAFAACHANAGGGRHGIIAHDARSVGGRRLAESVAARLRIEAPWLNGVQVHAVSVDSEHRWMRSCYALVGHVFDGPGNICGVVYEPAFIDHADAWGPEQSAAYARALADGVWEWAA
jgi:hypothetical protein